uniref:Uncharacterized protein n=1 Tax=Arundo donax TaxID=35708 RepID=A0A0A9GVM2_ARUDO
MPRHDFVQVNFTRHAEKLNGPVDAHDTSRAKQQLRFQKELLSVIWFFNTNPDIGADNSSKSY